MPHPLATPGLPAQPRFFFRACPGGLAARPVAVDRATSSSSALARLFHRALLSSKNRMRFFNTLMVAFAVRHFAFHCVRLLSKNRTNLLCGLLYGSPCAGSRSMRRACGLLSLPRVVIGHLCSSLSFQNKNGTIFLGKHSLNIADFHQPSLRLPSRPPPPAPCESRCGLGES